jgi:hypothetical protein
MDPLSLLATLWPLVISFVGLVAGVVAFVVRYQIRSAGTEKRFGSVEARLLALESQYQTIAHTLTRIETVLEMMFARRKDDD